METKENLLTMDFKRKNEILSDIDNLLLPSNNAGRVFDNVMKTYNSEMSKIQKSNMKLMFLVLRAYDYELHKLDETGIDFYGFTRKYFDLSKTTTSEILSVARRFGKYEIDDNTGKYIPCYCLDDFWSDYGFSQLYAMHRLPDNAIEEYIKPSYPVSRIKELVKWYNGISTLPFSDNNNESENDVDVYDEGEIETGESGLNESSAINPPETPTKKGRQYINRINFDVLMDKPLKLDATKKGYILSLDSDNNLVIELIVS